MASPRRIFRIYQRLSADAAMVREFQEAQGEKVSGTVTLLLEKDRAKLLTRFGEEMNELIGVLDGTHADSYLMEATQTFYWATLFAVTGGATWESVRFDEARHTPTGIGTYDELRAMTARVVALGDKAKPEKPFLLWQVADRFYRAKTPTEDQWSVDQLMEADLQDMLKRPYLQPILAAVPE